MIAPAQPFWDYSLRFYADPETQAACLDLQDRLGADVNIILYALYRASRGDQLDLGGLRQADQAVAAWRDDVVRPLRQVRRALKPHPHALSPAAQVPSCCPPTTPANDSRITQFIFFSFLLNFF